VASQYLIRAVSGQNQGCHEQFIHHSWYRAQRKMKCSTILQQITATCSAVPMLGWFHSFC